MKWCLLKLGAGCWKCTKLFLNFEVTHLLYYYIYRHKNIANQMIV